VTPDELIDVLWPSGPPTNPEDVLGALFSKLRPVLGASALQGSRELLTNSPGVGATAFQKAAPAPLVTRRTLFLPRLQKQSLC